jgi:hypothetical protein
MDCGHDIQQCTYVPGAVPPSIYRLIWLPWPSHGTTLLTILSAVPISPGTTMLRTDLQDTPAPGIRRDGGGRCVSEFHKLFQESPPMAGRGRHRAALVVIVAVIEHIMLDTHISRQIAEAILKDPVESLSITAGEATNGPFSIHMRQQFFIMSSY